MKKIIHSLLVGLCIYLLSACTPPAEKLYQQGRTQFYRHDYRSAFMSLFAAAKEGNVSAMYSLGYLYYYGLGVSRNVIEAMKWFKKASYYGNVDAINALHAIEMTAPKPFNLHQI